MTTANKDKLPNKPSELIRVALKDLEKVEADPKYEVDMTQWHAPRGDFCQVCLAGAVMAKSLGAWTTKEFAPELFDEEVQDKLRALDNFRQGFIMDGLINMNHTIPANIEPTFSTVPYVNSPKDFKTSLTLLADYLEKFEL